MQNNKNNNSKRNNGSQRTGERKEYKGNLAPSEKLVESTVELAKANCTSNQKTFLLRNLMELINTGLDSELNYIAKMLKEHGKNIKVTVKTDGFSFEALNEFESPSSNIGHSMIPIALAASKGKIPASEFMEFIEKSSPLIDNLKEVEEAAVMLIVNNNISLKEVQSKFLKTKVFKKKESLEKAEKVKKASLLKAEEKKKLKLKNKNKAQENNKKKDTSSNQTKKVDAKVKTEEKTNETVATEDIKKNDVEVKTVETTNETVITEDIKKEETKSTLPGIDTKNIEGSNGWKEFAKSNNVDIVGLSKKEDIYKAIEKAQAA